MSGWCLPRPAQTAAWGAYAALALLVSAAAAACSPAAEPAVEGTPAVARSEALATLTAHAGAAAGDAAAEGGAPNDYFGATPDAAAQADFRATQQAIDVAAGIADVGELIDRMPVLATFTPDARAAAPRGKLVYLRGGAFQSADADGGARQPLRLRPDGLPSVWAPPEDPGRAWSSPDGKHVAFFAGTDAELWIMSVDDLEAARVSEPNLPTDMHQVTAGGREQSVRLRAGQDYTLVVLPVGDTPLTVLGDDNSRHVRGEARLRVVHAAQLHLDLVLEARVNDASVGRAMAFGQSSGDDRVVSGQVSVALWTAQGGPLTVLPAFPAADRDLKTVFLYGADQLLAYQASYEPSSPPSGSARVRVFNAAAEPVDVVLANGIALARGLASGQLGAYVAVPAVMGVKERQDARLTLYGLRSGEEPVAWNAQGDRVAFLGVGDGRYDLFVAGPGVAAERVTDDEAIDYTPRWSPDGRALAWQSVDPTFDLHALRVWRGGRISTLDTSPIFEALEWSAATNVQFPGGVDWLDERRVFFFPKSNRGAAGLWIADVETGRLERLFDDAVSEIDFSPRARAWAFAAGGRPGEIVVLDANGRLSTVAGGDAHFPKWSPDGAQISWVEGAGDSPDGWRLHVVDADGRNDRVLTDWLPLLQSEPPVPGPNAKRWWLDDGRWIAFTRAGRDYGAAERRGTFGAGTAGDDIENLWLVRADGSSEPVQATDLTRVFYLARVEASPRGDALALVGFSYRDRSQQLWTIPAAGGRPTKVDGGVRWFLWLP